MSYKIESLNFMVFLNYCLTDATKTRNYRDSVFIEVKVFAYFFIY